MKTIPVYPGHIAIVDTDDHERLSKFKWTLHQKGNCKYARRNKHHPDGRQTTILMHREILSSPMIDHIDGNGLNNQRTNLRPCTNSQNSANRKKSKRNTSGFKGVCKRSKRWDAYIRVGGIQIHLGCFDTPEQAAHAYDRKAIEVFGEFARLNFPGNHWTKFETSRRAITWQKSS